MVAIPVSAIAGLLAYELCICCFLPWFLLFQVFIMRKIILFFMTDSGNPVAMRHPYNPVAGETLFYQQLISTKNLT